MGSKMCGVAERYHNPTSCTVRYLTQRKVMTCYLVHVAVTKRTERTRHNMKPDTRYAVRMYTLFVLLPCLALAIIGAVASVAHANQWAPTKTTCFNAADWDANLDNVPCTTVVQPDNDVVRVVQGTASAAMGECVISTAEVNDAICHRLPTIRHRRSVGTAGSKHDCNPTTHVCVKVGAVQEDGSVRLTVYQFNMLRPIETCILGNVSEERGIYSAPCEAVGVAVAS